jgi:hypothetical protein
MNRKRGGRTNHERDPLLACIVKHHPNPPTSVSPKLSSPNELSHVLPYPSKEAPFPPPPSRHWIPSSPKRHLHYSSPTPSRTTQPRLGAPRSGYQSTSLNGQIANGRKIHPPVPQLMALSDMSGRPCPGIRVGDPGTTLIPTSVRLPAGLDANGPRRRPHNVGR